MVNTLFRREVLDFDACDGCVTIGFGGREFPHTSFVATCRDELDECIGRGACRTVRFDMTGLNFIASEMLGLMASLRSRGIAVELIHASPYIRTVLQVSNVQYMFDLIETDDETTREEGVSCRATNSNAGDAARSSR